MDKRLTKIAKCIWEKKSATMYTIGGINSECNSLRGHLPFGADTFIMICGDSEKDTYIYTDGENSHSLKGIAYFEDSCSKFLPEKTFCGEKFAQSHLYTIPGPFGRSSDMTLITFDHALFVSDDIPSTLPDLLHRIAFNLLYYLSKKNPSNNYSVNPISDRRLIVEKDIDRVAEIAGDNREIRVSIDCDNAGINATAVNEVFMNNLSHTIFESMVSNVRLESIDSIGVHLYFYATL